MVLSKKRVKRPTNILKISQILTSLRTTTKKDVVISKANEKLSILQSKMARTSRILDLEEKLLELETR